MGALATSSGQNCSVPHVMSHVTIAVATNTDTNMTDHERVWSVIG